MTKILSFDSMFIVNPIRKLYILIIKKILNGKSSSNNRLILYRLDKDNIFLTDKRNISGETVGAAYNTIDSMSIKFYRYIEKLRSCKTILIKDMPLYQLYPRQTKLKLEGVLRCAMRLKNLLNDTEERIEIITDRQTASVMKEAFLFLNYTPTNLIWKVNMLLTLCISINSILMRSVAVIKMYVLPSNLPNEYFHKHINSDAPTVLITTPKIRPEDFFTMYVKEFNDKFNIVLWAAGFLDVTPSDYKRIGFKRTTKILRGVFDVENLMGSFNSYIADILLIYHNHADLSMSLDVTNSVFKNQIDAHISRLQTDPVNTYLAIESKRRGAFILGDIEEEIFYCDSAVCPSISENTESVSLALAKNGKVTYKGSNSMINYRLENFSNFNDDYLHQLLKVDSQKKIIFYASAPSKEQNQRYITEKLLINYFSQVNDFVLVIKTHPQDNGIITNNAYLDSSRPANVILIGDKNQGRSIMPKKFYLFEDFDFNAAIGSSDGFITMSSSSILEALILGVKTGIIDIFNNAFYDHLINKDVTMLINSEESLKLFLKKKALDIPDETLNYFGLKNTNKEFDLGTYLLKCLEEFDQKEENNQKMGN